MDELDNTLLKHSRNKSIDEINSEFYGAIKYPWTPQYFERYSDELFWIKMLQQDIGSWAPGNFPVTSGKIWVAGCGTNQALITALHFPGFHVTGSDLSQESLEECRKNAERLNVKNLTLKKESINENEYVDEFDYIISTGVIHHNADPGATLEQICRALKPNGILELMVYNRYHRILTTAFQKAVRMMRGQSNTYDFKEEGEFAQRMAESLKAENLLKHSLKQSESASFAAFADAWLQPVEHSYTIETLNSMIEKSGFALLGPKIDQFSKVTGQYNWNLTFTDPEVQARYNTMPDIERWQVANLLLGEVSPGLWFYAVKSGNGNRKSEQQVCNEFLQQTFVRTKLWKHVYNRKEDGTFVSDADTYQFPSEPRYSPAKRVYDALDEGQPILKTFQRLGIRTDFNVVNMLRMNLTTSAFPFLMAKELYDLQPTV